MSGIEITETAIEGVKRLKSAPFVDERGSFSRLFCQETLPFPVSQANLSRNKKRATLRGLHYQKGPHAEDKLIFCIQGLIFDVIIDLRSDSPTFGRHVAYELHPGEGVLAPKGTAHGFLTLEDESELIYFCSRPYNAQAACGVLWSDPDLAIAWPMKPLVLSKADQQWPTLSLETAI